jgi:hypothetical protein
MLSAIMPAANRSAALQRGSGGSKANTLPARDALNIFDLVKY